MDLILCTHTHNDHFDVKAKELLDKNIPLLCQWSDEEKLGAEGFLNLYPIKNKLQFQEISITRVNARHGSGGICKAMGPTSGYILSSEKEPTVYITGDTIFYKEIKDNIINYQPRIMIMNAGSPKFLYSNRIVMNIIDIEKALKVIPGLTYVMVHLDAFNHCIETRDDLREYFTKEKLDSLGVGSFLIPEDNELLEESCFS